MRRIVGLSDRVASLDPGAFAVVMATAIVSSAMADLGLSGLSRAMLALAVALLLALGTALVWRLFGFGSRALADAQDPDKAFGYFTLTASASVIALGFAGHDKSTVLALSVVSAAMWLPLLYALPTLVLVGRRARSVLHDVNGGWLLSVVATQSLAALAATLASLYPHGIPGLAVLAVGLWGLGVGLYVMLTVLVTLRLLDVPVTAATLDPTYWILMGATGSTVLAGAKILSLPRSLPVLVASREVIAGGSVLLWAIGTWWIPLLVALGAWRYLVRHQPVCYDSGLWSIVFPLGMYAVSGEAFGHAAGLSFMIEAARAEVWLGLAAWCLVSVLFIHSQWTRSAQ